MVPLCLLVLLLGADPGRGGPCAPEGFAIAIDVGHSPESPGATSARGVREYEFNRDLAQLLFARLQAEGFKGSFVITGGREDLTLRERAERANRAKADLLISIHHDSVQPFYLSPWSYGGRRLSYSDRFSGYSVFLCGSNGPYAESLILAEMVGRRMREAGFKPSLHHAEPVEGERRTLLDREKGIYRDDGLAILRAAKMAAILLECGVIVNRDEEAALATPAYREKIVEALVSAFKEYCGRK
jgi:N-acetylmuramoyl-L-alanine amidase